MTDRRKSIPPSYVAAECQAAALTLESVAVRLEALATFLPPSARALRGVVEVATRDHLHRAVEGLRGAR